MHNNLIYIQLQFNPVQCWQQQMEKDAWVLSSFQRWMVLVGFATQKNENHSAAWGKKTTKACLWILTLTLILDGLMPCQLWFLEPSINQLWCHTSLDILFMESNVYGRSVVFDCKHDWWAQLSVIICISNDHAQPPWVLTSSTWFLISVIDDLCCLGFLISEVPLDYRFCDIRPSNNGSVTKLVVCPTYGSQDKLVDALDGWYAWDFMKQINCFCSNLCLMWVCSTIGTVNLGDRSW